MILREARPSEGFAVILPHLIMSPEIRSEHAPLSETCVYTCISHVMSGRTDANGCALYATRHQQASDSSGNEHLPNHVPVYKIYFTTLYRFIASLGRDAEWKTIKYYESEILMQIYKCCCRVKIILVFDGNLCTIQCMYSVCIKLHGK